MQQHILRVLVDVTTSYLGCSPQFTVALCSCGGKHLLSDIAHEHAEMGAPVSEFVYMEELDLVVMREPYEKFMKEYAGLFH